MQAMFKVAPSSERTAAAVKAAVDTVRNASAMMAMVGVRVSPYQLRKGAMRAAVNRACTPNGLHFDGVWESTAPDIRAAFHAVMEEAGRV